MTTATAKFFDRLAGMGHDPRLRNVKGTLQFDIVDGSATMHWHVAVLHGDLAVSQEEAAADGTFQAPRELFDKIVLGQANVLSAVLRGAVTYRGDPKFGVVFRRLFGPVEQVQAGGQA